MDDYAEQAQALPREELEGKWAAERRLREEAELCLRYLGHPTWRKSIWPQVRLRHFHGEFQPKR